ncbi:hypothetical protein Psch_02623 [Pelotomaculum schinkii]|uniref:Uncharacterized protein n=1 Tax=Pelotomaculum schinkii TaxID=78350 RepID=A0A4Y7R9X6_9FIRM|nr:hypothetical protein [Pelotomaculum schinkii]TEB05582.1 hypothetical protein Psch_02623 [Pelotomaculum schinkii]
MKPELESLVDKAIGYYNAGDFEKEIEQWKLVIKHDSKNPLWVHNLALSLMNNADYNGSYILFEYLLQNYPDLSRVHNNFAVLLIRMGADKQDLIPVLKNALILSEDVEEFISHFMNLCNIIAYGFEGDASILFDEIETLLPEIMEKLYEPKRVDQNLISMTQVLQGMRIVSTYRRNFANKKWKSAEESLQQAIWVFSNLGLNNFVNGINHYVKPLFQLCKEVMLLLEEIGTNTELSPDVALNKFKCLLELAQSSERRQDSVNVRLLDMLGWFMTSFVNNLVFIADPKTPYNQDTSPQQAIMYLSANYFNKLGSDLISILNFVNNQCANLSEHADRVFSKKLIEEYRNTVWSKISLFCNGLVLDFCDVDLKLSRSMLGWDKDPINVSMKEIQEFKSLVERQTYADIYVNGKPQENIARALLQTFLTSRSYREVLVRGGRSDLLSFTKNGRFLYETKIWRGQDYYIQGLEELEEYIIGEDDENLLGVFYVIFDPTKSGKAKKHINSYIKTVGRYHVNVIIIHIKPQVPSKKGKDSL